MSIFSREPVLTASSTLAVVGAVLGFLTSAGYISATQASAWTQLAATVVPLVLPLIGGFLVRRKVTPTASTPLGR